jgi:hypothetical protein
VALFWNTWQHEDDPLNSAYNVLLEQFGIEYTKVRHTRLADTDFGGFFTSYERAAFPNPLTYDLDGLKGRSLSSSYVPLPGHPNHAPMMDALDTLFGEFQREGVVTFQYETEVYCGRIV